MLSQVRVMYCVSPRSPLLAELLASDGVDRSTFCSSLELRKNFSHDGADLRCTTRNRGTDCSAQLIVARCGRKILLECLRFGSFLIGEIDAAGLVVHLDR